MAAERENVLTNISQVPYTVDGNVFRAYLDATGALLFVVDETITDDKPNVMLVMDGVPGRKWDDVLAHDYGVDLEDVRPRRDNKYQKLDIEYDGLDVYRALIDAIDNGGDVDAARDGLMRFRVVSARRAATERLAAATDAADKARETIARTNETIAELQARIKELRAKLNQQKKSIGREPTKQSASKILRTEAQIDAANEKLARAKKRLAAARRRMAVADENADIARAILARVADVATVDTVTRAAPVVPVNADVAIYDDTVAADDADETADNADVSDDAQTENQSEQLEEYTEPRTEEMPDDKEVKPLFDKDPEILDEEIAFKPIDFNVGSVAAHADTPRSVMMDADTVIDVDETVAPAPLAFTPPTRNADDATTGAEPRPVSPVLDTITSVDVPVTDGGVVTETIETESPAVSAEPVYDNAAASAARPVAAVAPAPADSGFRPVSPIKKQDAAVVSGDAGAHKPTLVYYVMLIVLIVMSVFTLWVYQKSNRDTLPDLAATTQTQVVEETTPAPVENKVATNPFIDDDVTPPAPVVEVAETVTAPEVVAEPEPEPEPEPVPVVAIEDEEEFIDVDIEDEPVPVQPVVVEDDSPFIDMAPVVTEEPKYIPTEEEVLASKPSYNVSQQEKMFIADENYDSDRVYDDGLDYDEGPVMETAVAETVTDEMVCDNGGAPDMYGCCPGEEYTDLGPDGFACCAGDDCYPPMF